mmetsp:Transcript_25669/g.62889  ORF Transcript_25669/g.62889 Transcript_25669/m.62889 type:complete len:1006 (+) Transcript_25669:157-3174(+)|eukprot:CAMPEP_0113626562 /NCGR_PEP_ID=MMETSP0017_2-20120614/13738_1 /TAXON_ID=2856 /ORGANISM="Cylindrotheca closterium" /LENGTH=1005 /DNA_ID=CAMNT_0000536749 /DNA_START=96 /DNA_END=3113 /DNA_ORIENTATION=+ /assembly_acc=CAM_ASM_000147
MGRRKKKSSLEEPEESANYVDMGDGESPLSPGESSPRRRTQDRSAGDNSDSESMERRRRIFEQEYKSDGEETEADGDTYHTAGVTTILRYRGFSTSIKDFFLDEALVCASIGCFGLFLSNRTEHLLQLRNDRRGVRWGRSSSKNSLPSRIIAYALLLTLALIGITFVIWGFGTGNASPMAQNWYDGYDVFVETDDAWKWEDKNKQAQIDDDQYRYWFGTDDDNATYADDQYAVNDYNNSSSSGNKWWNFYKSDDDNSNNDDGSNSSYYNNDDDDGNNRMLEVLPNGRIFQQRHPVQGIFKLRDMDESLWQPAIAFLKDEWNRLPNAEDNTDRRLYESMYGNNNGDNRDMAQDVRLTIFFAFLILLGIFGRRRRMRTRYYLVRARAQEDHLYYASAAAGLKKVTFQDSREDQYEGACSHTLCGCYPIDPPAEGEEVVDDEIHVDELGVTGQKKKRHVGDIMTRFFSCLMSLCCGAVCKFWCQCLSICALAQEAREIRLLVPTRYQRLDYFTHQPFVEYAKEINDLRRGWLGKMRKKSGLMPHFHALSKLSRYILIFFASSMAIMAVTLVFNPRAKFSWPDMVILAATFGQSFLVLLFVHWIFHYSDLSLDAVIKFFAAGFLIAVPAAFMFEGILVNLSLMLGYFLFSIGEKIAGDSFTYFVIAHIKIFWVIGEFLSAYVVAALVEELCKYYTFRTVEHPDLVFLTGLQRSSQDERVIEGGMVKYPFGPHQIENTNRKVGTSYDEDDADRNASYKGNSHRKNQKSSGGEGEGDDKFDLTKHFGEDGFMDEEEPDVRTFRQKAGAVTTGMISVAVGLACAENFVYVFLLGGTAGNSGDAQSGGILEEWLVLLFRSCFPVHALAAAMQSVNVIRKFIETKTDDDNHRIGIGRIVFPAILMHGTFDVVLLAVNVYIETVWEKYLVKYGGKIDPDDPPYDPVTLNVVAFSSIAWVMFVGLVWYWREFRNQRQRLISLEVKEKAIADSQPDYKSPSELSSPGSKPAGDIELV